jgi:hypothetical protein
MSYSTDGIDKTVLISSYAHYSLTLDVRPHDIKIDKKTLCLAYACSSKPSSMFVKKMVFKLFSIHYVPMSNLIIDFLTSNSIGMISFLAFTGVLSLMISKGSQDY